MSEDLDPEALEAAYEAGRCTSGSILAGDIGNAISAYLRHIPAPCWVDYEVWQGDMMVASSNSLREAHHYMMVYAQDGPVTLMKCTRARLDKKAT